MEISTLQVLSKEDTNILLKSIGMKLGDWNEVKNLKLENAHSQFTFKYFAPKIARNLYSFSHCVANWLPKGQWKICQIDNSTSLSIDEELFLSSLLSPKNQALDFSSQRSFLFKFGYGEKIDDVTDLVISNIIFLFLLFEAHCYFVSSGSDSGRSLSIQDGVVYFLSTNKNDQSDAKKLIKKYENNPTKLADTWIYSSHYDRMAN